MATKTFRDRKLAPERRAAPGSDLSLRDFRATLGMPRPLFARLMGCSERALANWEAGRPLPDIHRSRFNELRRIYEELSEVVDPDSIGDWLTTPHDDFDGLKPLELIERGDTFRLWRMIFLLKSGTPA